MIDMLVRLYELPDTRDIYDRVEQQGIILRRARAYERHIVAGWAGENSSSPGVWFLRLLISLDALTGDPMVAMFAPVAKDPGLLLSLAPPKADRPGSK